MVRLECTHESLDGVTLVECRLASEVPEQVTLETTHEGPVWPPRRQGVPEAGWAGSEWSGLVPADRPLALGYATPVEPDERPMRVVASEPASDAPASPGPRDVLRALGDPRPPRDAVEPDGGQTITDAGPEPEPRPAERSPGGNPDSTLDAIERRLERAERLAAVDSVDEARVAVEAVGGIEAVRGLVAQLDRDRETLDRLATRVTSLRDRAAVTVPVDDLDRLV
jgi:hypothetical protein